VQPIYRTIQIRDIERQWFAAHPGVSLMERAGLAAAEQARDLLGDGYTVLVVCGPGNNGGDGLVAARELRHWGYRVTTVFLGERHKLPADAALAHADFLAAGGVLDKSIPQGGRWDLVIDALFGVGLTRPIQGAMAKIVGQVNALQTKVLALDIPSGLDSDTGTACGAVVRATQTLTFISLKPGLLTSDARDFCGEIRVASLAIDATLSLAPQGRLLDQQAVASYMHRRGANSHKGSFGSVAVIGGAGGMVGACVLAARAALKLGAGRVYAAPLGGIPTGYDPLQPELMWRKPQDLLRLEQLTAVVIGPGMGRAAEARVGLSEVLEGSLPLIIDADALNLLAEHEPLQAALAVRTGPTILTPHPGEAARLLGTSAAHVQGDRVAAATKLAVRFHCHVLLKGAGSICAAPDGRWFINPTGNPGMASAGMGDVLSGVIAALVGQGLAVEQALLLGVYLHGAAADALVAEGIGPVGLTASDVTDRSRSLLNEWLYAPSALEHINPQ
jgi:hydroxyethylthiazole kinase-like uncharacterized protein yjeF